jgi:DNA-directed RNA polymerase subunit RPC12/RpoP
MACSLTTLYVRCPKCGKPFHTSFFEIKMGLGLNCPVCRRELLGWDSARPLARAIDDLAQRGALTQEKAEQLLQAALATC